MLGSVSGPGVVHNGPYFDWEFLAEVPVDGISKKFGPLSQARLSCLQRLILLNFCSEVDDQVGHAEVFDGPFPAPPASREEIGIPVR